VFLIVARSAQAVHVWHTRQQANDPPAAGLHTRAPPGVPYHLGLALLAAALYVFTAAGFMTTWWSFSTHIYTQFFTLLLITAVHEVALRAFLRQQDTPAREHIGRTLLLFVLCALVFLGHFGFFINTALLGGLALLLLWPLAWRGTGWARSLRVPITIAGVGAGVAALALFYSYFVPLFAQQAQAAAEGGLTGLANRPPVERSRLWEVLWYAGFVQHFGFFPLVLAPIGVWMIARRGGPAWVTAALLVGSFLVSVVFAILPFITLSTQSTRWLMFSAWAVAIGAAAAVPLFWRRGLAGRLAVVAMAGFIIWNTVMLWIGPLLWRIRPPEPF
jgi:hypothetical protein